LSWLAALYHGRRVVWRMSGQLCRVRQDVENGHSGLKGPRGDGSGRCVTTQGPLRRLEKTGGMDAAAPAWQILEYRGRTGLEMLQADWQGLYAEMTLRTSFHAYDVQLAFVDHLMEAPDKLRCLALTDGQRVRAICLLETKVYRRLGLALRVWRLPHMPHSVVCDVLCPEDEARRELIPALVHHLLREPEGHRLFYLGPLPEDSRLWDGLRHLDHGRHCVDTAEGMHVVDCSKPLDELVPGLSKKSRTSLRKSRQRLDSLPGARFVTAASDTELGAEFETFLDLEASGWKGAQGSSIRLRPKCTDFFDALSRLHAAGDRCEINALYAEGRCIASELCVRTGSEYTALKIAYDESYSRVAPGLLLVSHTVERCCQDPGILRLNWVGASAWERRWHPDVVTLRRAYVGLGRWSGRPLIALLRFRLGPARHVARWLRRERDRLKRRRADLQSSR